CLRRRRRRVFSLSRFRLSATNRTCPSSFPSLSIASTRFRLSATNHKILTSCSFVLSLNSFRDLTVGPCAGGDVKSSSLQIPNELKAHLVNRLRKIGKKKYS
ncbi:unnamed protein product, partial [Brassica rapa subsp. trilocularis]